jgi:hypothetical protein
MFLICLMAELTAMLGRVRLEIARSRRGQASEILAAAGPLVEVVGRRASWATIVDLFLEREVPVFPVFSQLVHFQ